MITGHDRELLRDLARRVAEIAGPAHSRDAPPDVAPVTIGWNRDGR